MKNIFFGIAIRNRAWCLGRYLNGLHSLNYPKKNIHVYFHVNDSTDSTENILQEYKRKYGNLYKNFIIEVKNYNIPEDRRDKNTVNLRPHHTALKNLTRIRFLESGCDYWLQSDSDSPVKVDTLTQFLSRNQPVLFGWCNVNLGYDVDGKFKTNIMKKIEKTDSFYRVKVEDIKRSKELFEADWVGGISFISREVAGKCEYFNKIEHKDDNLGFCFNVKKIMGLKILVDPKVLLDHLMKKDEVEKDGWEKQIIIEEEKVNDNSEQVGNEDSGGNIPLVIEDGDQSAKIPKKSKRGRKAKIKKGTDKQIRPKCGNDSQ